MKAITSIEEIKEADDTIECFIMLAGGRLRSSKRITYDKGAELFEVYHEIDDTEQTLTEKEFKKSIIFEAMEKGALIEY